MGIIFNMRDKIIKDWENFKPSSIQDNPLEIVIKNNNLDSNRIINYANSTNFKFDFKPQNWNQFIGQIEAKERAKFIIKKAKMGLKSHVLLDGLKGHGKSTYIELLANDLNAHLIRRIGKQIDENNLVDIINEINLAKEEFVIFFCDETDSLEWQVIKILNPILENFEINDKKIKPFIFAGATINKHILIKNNPDALDRIPTHIKFVRYSLEELKTIIKQYKDNLYPNIMVSENIYDIISNNCKFNPRTAIALLSDYIVEKDINRILQSWQIIKEGLTKSDVKILQILNDSKKALGANCLALKCGMSEKEYITEIEPFLLEFEYINRVPSRIISEKGKQFLQEVLK